MTGAPVVPIGLWGTEKVWPRSSRLPNLLNIVDPPSVSVTVGPAVELGGVDPDADTQRIMAAIVTLLPAEARRHREPTAEELALATPSGHTTDPDGDTEHESHRRPGTD
jgi:putative phosphoserine phosphatase/1-acylglycerol-3-phosphate O-acyltransferase